MFSWVARNIPILEAGPHTLYPPESKPCLIHLGFPQGPAQRGVGDEVRALNKNYLEELMRKYSKSLIITALTTEGLCQWDNVQHTEPRVRALCQFLMSLLKTLSAQI